VLSPRDLYFRRKQQCRFIRGIGVALIGTVVIVAGAQSAMGLEWLADDTPFFMSVGIMAVSVFVSYLLGPRCPYCGGRMTVVTLEGGPNAGLEADTCSDCLRSLPQ
jgi:hypothetical protein